MEVVIIADDLTGANDSGVKLARRQLSTSVLLQIDKVAAVHEDAIVLNTDSRSLNAEEAYRRVSEAAAFASRLNPRIVFKKIDSTLRGNLGAELDAVYEQLRPEFIVVAPAFPVNGRTTVQGVHYLNGQPIHETDIALDPKTPVTESNLPLLLGAQTKQRVSLLNLSVLRSGKDAVSTRIDEMRQKEIAYIVADAEREDDLQTLVAIIQSIGCRVVWAGSAGLAKYLPMPFKQLKAPSLSPFFRVAEKSGQRSPLLIAVGSASERARVQLQTLAASPAQNIEVVTLKSELLVGGEEVREAEIQRVVEACREAFRCHRHTALHVSASRADVLRAQTEGAALGMTVSEVSDCIAQALGEAAGLLLEHEAWGGVVMTGGDTAARICDHLDAERFTLLDEVEPGVPIGLLIGGSRVMYAVTKAGGFGSDQALLRAVTMIEEWSER